MLALLAEGLVALLLLTLAPRLVDEKAQVPLVTFNVAPDAVPDENPEPPAPEHSEAAKTPEHTQPKPPKPAQAPEPQPPSPSQPEKAPPAMIELAPDQMASTDISRPTPAPPAKPSKPARVYGPVADPRYAVNAGDTPRVSGSGPHGEPLYAASWYREPYDDELSGFLSAAKGPGWGMIACKTAPHYRVEDCVKVDEYPERSGIAQAVLAAAFQFRVRPPQIGGVPQIGAWVRIRIDYEMGPRSPSG
ncbi:hypothetical protein [Stakelama marina]|uniref:hypothetical protein n=1 Tax=Stakelama marina TaxID=2826939 RepID=UPI0024C443B2|nr:hypothetical protein [Stakelama marina]